MRKADSNSRRVSREGKMELVRQTTYSGKFLREILARMMVVSDFSVHSVDR